MRNVKFGFAAGCEAVAMPRRHRQIILGYALGFGRRNGITGRALNPSLRDRMICFRRCWQGTTSMITRASTSCGAIIYCLGWISGRV
jgi:hypothetical protein